MNTFLIFGEWYKNMYYIEQFIKYGKYLKSKSAYLKFVVQSILY